MMKMTTVKTFGSLREGNYFRLPEADTEYRVTYVRHGSPRTTVEFVLADSDEPFGNMMCTRTNLSTTYVREN